MVEQFARDYLRLYPAARVLTPHGTTQKDAVREFLAGGLRVRGDLRYLSDLGMELGFLHRPL